VSLGLLGTVRGCISGFSMHPISPSTQGRGSCAVVEYTEGKWPPTQGLGSLDQFVTASSYVNQVAGGGRTGSMDDGEGM
jgi:hypothetical protein